MHAARGRRCNQYEAKLFASVDERRRAMLCPVRWCSSDGVLLVMASAKPLTKSDHENLLDGGSFPNWDYMPSEDGGPFESRASDWGRINGRLALDHSTPVHDTAEELDELRRQAGNERAAPSPLIWMGPSPTSVLAGPKSKIHLMVSADCGPTSASRLRRSLSGAFPCRTPWEKSAFARLNPVSFLKVDTLETRARRTVTRNQSAGNGSPS